MKRALSILLGSLWLVLSASACLAATPAPSTPTGILHKPTTPTDAQSIWQAAAVTVSDQVLSKIPTSTSTDTGDMQVRHDHAGQFISSTSTNVVWYVSPVDLKRYYFDGSATSLNFLQSLDKSMPAKNFLIDLSSQTLQQRVGTEVLATYRVSTGKPSTPTPKGTFKTFYKNPRAWSNSAGLWMPWFQEFTKQGAGLHELPEWPNGMKEGANHLGVPVSHGCVRLGVGPAKLIYDWAPIGTTVTVQQ